MWLLIVVALVVGSGFMLLLPLSATEVIYERGLIEGRAASVCMCVDVSVGLRICFCVGEEVGLFSLSCRR